MYPIPVLLTLAVLNVAQAAPLSQPDRDPTAHSKYHPRLVLEPLESARAVKRAALIYVCINTITGVLIRHPVGGQCTGEWQFRHTTDPIFGDDTEPVMGSPVTSQGIEKGNPILDVEIGGTDPGVPTGQFADNPQGVSPAASSGVPTSASNDGLFGGNSGTGLLGLLGPQDPGSNVDGNSNAIPDANSGSGSQAGKDSRGSGLSAGDGATSTDPDSRGSEYPPQFSDVGNQAGYEGGGTAYTPNDGPIFAGHSDTGANRSPTAPSGDNGLGGPGADDHEWEQHSDHKSDHEDNGDVMNDHESDDVNDGDFGADDRDDHERDGPPYPGSDSNPDDCEEEKGEGDSNQSHSDRPIASHFRGGPGPVKLPHSAGDPGQPQSHPRPWPSKPKFPYSTSRKHRHSPPKDKSQSWPASSYSDSPSFPPFSWKDDEPESECVCEK